MAARSVRCFPNQGAKLGFLIYERGDQRERSEANPTRIRDAASGGHPRDVDGSVVFNQADLASFLRVSEAVLSRWCNDNARFPDHHLPELSRLYALRESDFRTLSHLTFVSIYGDATTGSQIGASALSIIWRMLLRTASGHAEILLAPPADDVPHERPIARLRYATARDPHAAEPLPEIVRGASFWIRLVSPQQPDASLTWAGWHLALLNYDLGHDGFRALLPRETNHPAHWADRLPATGLLTLPRAAILRHEPPDLGEYAIVAVLTRDPLPPALLDTLSQERMYGLALEPTLDALTAHLVTAVRDGRAAITAARYRVVSPGEAGPDD